MSHAINKMSAGNPVGGRVIGNNIYKWVIGLKLFLKKCNFACWSKFSEMVNCTEHVHCYI